MPVAGPHCRSRAPPILHYCACAALCGLSSGAAPVLAWHTAPGVSPRLLLFNLFSPRHPPAFVPISLVLQNPWARRRLTSTWASSATWTLASPPPPGKHLCCYDPGVGCHTAMCPWAGAMALRPAPRTVVHCSTHTHTQHAHAFKIPSCSGRCGGGRCWDSQLPSLRGSALSSLCN
jgi:hypothetical protein